MNACSIHNMDCIKGLASVKDASIDLTVTSPPYDNLREYNGAPAWDAGCHALLSDALFRVTKPGGVVVWVAGDATIRGSETGTSFRQALTLMDAGFRLHDTMVYAKQGFVYPETNRYYPAFEYMFVLSKGKPKTTNLITDRPNRCAGKAIVGTERKPDGTIQPRSAVRSVKPRLVAPFGVRSNIWEYPVGNCKTTRDRFAYAHPAMFPEALAKDHILTWSEPGDTVLDPFLGSGTTAKMAVLTGRRCIGFEIDGGYFVIAKRRVDLAEAQAGDGA
jgi:site-specific DNA-methyltransferase (adenine-specific)